MIGDFRRRKQGKIDWRRMFILSAKAVVVFGVVGRLISLQINEVKKYKTLSDKIDFVNGNLFHLAVLLKIILEMK